RDVTGNHIEALVAGLRAGGFSPSTTAQAFRLCSAVLDRAVGLGLLPRHPVDRDTLRTVIRPMLRTAKHSRVKAFTQDQARAFLDAAARCSRFSRVYTTGFLTGLRLGELLGLQITDDQVNVVDGRHVRQLGICRTLNPRSVRTAMVGPTKNGRDRMVDVGADLGVMLDAIRADRPKLALRSGWRPVPPWT